MAGSIVQHTLTVVAKVTDAQRARQGVRAVAAAQQVTRPGCAAQPMLFAAESLGVHFGRVFLIDEPAHSPYSSWVVLESNFDSDESDRDRAIRVHLDALTRERPDALRELFSGCGSMAADLRRGMADAVVRSTAEYQGHVGRDLRRIRSEERVHEIGLQVVSKAPAGSSLKEIRDRIRAEVKRCASEGDSDLVGLDVDAPAPGYPDPAERRKKLNQTWGPWLDNGLRLFGGGNRALGASALAGLFPLWAGWIGYAALRGDMGPEFDLQREAEGRGPPAFQRLLDTEQAEDYVMQNALTHLVPLKSGLIGSATLRLLHRYIALMAKNYFDEVEQLGGIPSIHFAKWLLIDEDRRLLFLSNYDGSWESYLGDFVDQAAIGLNLAWCLTEGYPRTQLFAAGGAHDEERFKAWARSNQVPTPLFYSAYPTLSLSGINNNTWLRHGLHQGAAYDEEWLRRLT